MVVAIVSPPCIVDFWKLSLAGLPAALFPGALASAPLIALAKIDSMIKGVQIGATNADEPICVTRGKARRFDPAPDGALANVSETRCFGDREKFVTCARRSTEPFEELVDHFCERTQLVANDRAEELFEARLHAEHRCAG